MKSVPDGLYIVHDGHIYFDAKRLIQGMSSAGLLAYSTGMITDEKLAGFIAAVKPMERMLDACIREAGLNDKDKVEEDV